MIALYQHLVGATRRGCLLHPRRGASRREGAARDRHGTAGGGPSFFASDPIRSLNDGDIEQRVAVLRGGPSMPADYDALDDPARARRTDRGFRVEMRCGFAPAP